MIAFTVSYLRSEEFREKIQETLFKTAVVPEQAQGIVNYVSGCIEDLSKDGIRIMGLQGGYITFPDRISTNPRTYLQFTENIKIPYWVYGESITTNIPSINGMEMDLENYIEGRFADECGFGTYKEQGYVFSDDGIDVNVDIGNNNVKVKLNSALKVQIKENEFDLGNYVLVSISSRIKEFYEMANDIVDRELRNAPIEFIVLNLISAWSKDKDSGIAPYASFDYKCNPIVYNFISLGNELRRRISIETPKIQLEKTITYDYGEDYNFMIIDNVFNNDHDDVNVQFNFFEGWPFVLEVQPRQGILMRSNVLRIPLPLSPDLCFNSYDFRYTMFYPVVVSLETDGELFNFPIEVYMEDNYGRRSAFGTTPRRIDATGLFCEENQRLSNDVEVKVYDNINGEELIGVRINYICGINSCIVGETKEKEDGTIGFKEKFPICYGGEIQLDKEGYGIYRTRLDTLDAPERSIVANLEPYRELNLGIKIIDLDERNEVIGNRDVRTNENVILQLNKINNEFGGYDERISIIYSPSEENKIKLVPGRYDAVIDLNLKENMILEGQNVQGIEIEDQEVNEVVLGHVEFVLDITEGDLLNDNINFNVFGIRPRFVQDLVRGYEMADLTENYRPMLDPEYS